MSGKVMSGPSAVRKVRLMRRKGISAAVSLELHPSMCSLDAEVVS
jgi:hypothetical protein